jgi:EAL domain-containing protein (putative c-di-GMP-specific phosphodiesterase class I)
LDGQRYGVIVGINAAGPNAGVPPLRFAERDAHRLCARLTDAPAGAFDPACVRLLTGAAATTRAVKAALRDAALAMSPSDVLLVYFAGHAVMSPWLRYDDPYLVTADLDPAALRADPDSGLRLSFLRRDVFEAGQGSSYLILDTGQATLSADLAGAGAPRPLAALGPALEEFAEAHSVTRGALFYCAPDGSARENAQLGHGVLTHFLLRGLAGEVAAADGAVTFEALAEYVRGQEISLAGPRSAVPPQPPAPLQPSAPTQQHPAHQWPATRQRPAPPQRPAAHQRPTLPQQPAPPQRPDLPQWPGPGSGLVLTRVPPSRTPGQLMAGSQPPGSATATAIESLANPLDVHLSSLQLLLDRIFHPGLELAASLASPEHGPRLELLRHATDAVAAAEVCLMTGKVIASAGRCPGGQVFDDVFRERLAGRNGSKSVLGSTYLDSGASRPRQLIVFLHQLAARGTVLVLTDPAPCFVRIGEPLAIILHALWDLPMANDLLEAEVLVLSALRAEFGRLPGLLYRSCLSTYSQLLHSLVMVFEPVMILDATPELVDIQSWEALARRDVAARRAPAATLAVPDTWGDRFVIERDTILAGKAIASYAQAHARGPWSRDHPKPVSINVSVRSLLSEVYEQALAQAISDAGLPPHTVTLEISERDAIEPHPDEAGHWQPTPIAFFQARLHHLARSLHVNFAVDDFGVGHASLDRVSSLDLAQIKVDRSILHHSLALGELELVVQLASEPLHGGSSATPRAVVVEGFDGESPVSLRDLYARGIRYVQGYITEEPASPDLRPLNADVRRRVAAMVGGSG